MKNLFSCSVGIFLILSLLKADQSAFAQVSEDWVSRIQQVGASNQRTLKLAVDRYGAPHVLMEDTDNGTGSDLLVIKYDQDGNEEWRARYNGPANGGDYPVAIKVDESGNVYVTGESEGNDYHPDDPCYVSTVDYVTAKYSPSGEHLWTSRFNGPAMGGDAPAGLVVDSAGSTYVTGTSYTSSTCINYPDYFDLKIYHDFLTIKYDRNGNELWQARFNASQQTGAKALSLAKDADGNHLYVMGESNHQIAIVKYDNQGIELWANSVPGREPAFIAVDVAGNVYVAATGTGNSPIHRLDENGQVVWSRWIGTWSNLVNLVTDSAGNVYVGGSEDNDGTGIDFALVKWDPGGSQIWKTNYRGGVTPYRNDQAAALAISAVGDVYITGYNCSNLAMPQDIVTVKYDSNGNQVWVSEWFGTSGASNTPYAISLDSSQNVYVGGSDSSGGFFEYVLIKFNQGDNELTPEGGTSSGGGGGGGCFIDAAR